MVERIVKPVSPIGGGVGTAAVGKDICASAGF
jgi:hypothetical protein